jgi:hypothetical protein
VDSRDGICDCAGVATGSAESEPGEEVWISVEGGKDEDVWEAWSGAILVILATLATLAAPDVDAGKVLDEFVLVEFSKMSFCAPSRKWYKSR